MWLRYNDLVEIIFGAPFCALFKRGILLMNLRDLFDFGNRGNSNSGSSDGFFQDLIVQGKLVWALVNDPEVPTLYKGIPTLSLLYLIFPADIMPDIIPLLGQADDIGVLLLGARMFINICPPHIVEKHRAIIEGRATAEPRWEGPDGDLEGEDIEDAIFSDLD